MPLINLQTLVPHLPTNATPAPLPPPTTFVAHAPRTNSLFLVPPDVAEPWFNMWLKKQPVLQIEQGFAQSCVVCRSCQLGVPAKPVLVVSLGLQRMIPPDFAEPEYRRVFQLCPHKDILNVNYDDWDPKHCVGSAMTESAVRGSETERTPAPLTNFGCYLHNEKLDRHGFVGACSLPCSLYISPGGFSHLGFLHVCDRLHVSDLGVSDNHKEILVLNAWFRKVRRYLGSRRGTVVLAPPRRCTRGDSPDECKEGGREVPPFRKGPRFGVKFWTADLNPLRKWERHTEWHLWAPHLLASLR